MEYPTLGISQCWNDLEAGALWVETYCATPSRRGAATTLQVSGLPSVEAIRILLDGSEFTGWSPAGAGTIEIRSDVDTHCFRIETGYHGDPIRSPTTAMSAQTPGVVRSATVVTPTALASASLYVASAGSGGCSCC